MTNFPQSLTIDKKGKEVFSDTFLKSAKDGFAQIERICLLGIFLEDADRLNQIIDNTFIKRDAFQIKTGVNLLMAEIVRNLKKS